MQLRLALLFPLVFLGASLHSASLAQTLPHCGLTPEQAITLRQISDLRFSPDGSRIAMVVSEPPLQTLATRHIWVYQVSSHDMRQFTNSEKSEYSPRWSPDGRRLAFLSDRNGEPSLYGMPVDGGEAVPLVKDTRSISSFAWSPDGARIAFIGPDPETPAEKKKKEDKEDAFVVDQDNKLPRLWILDLAAGSARAISPGRWRVSAAEWLPSGDGLVVSASRRPEEDYPTNRLYRTDPAAGDLREIAAPRGPFSNIQISLDGQSVAYLAARVDGPEPHDLYVQSLRGGAARNLTAGSIDRAITAYRWQADGGLLALAQSGFENKLYRVSPQGRASALAGPPVDPMSFAVARTGAIAFVGETFTKAPELWLWDRPDAPMKISSFNKAWADITLSPMQIVHYNSFDGLEIEAGSVAPCGSPRASRPPTVFLIHGGPTGAWRDSVNTWAQLLAARGYAVFVPNIRGSTGYGDKFMEMNHADWGGKDFRDVMAGVDFLLGRGAADPGRIGICGWSYGGYMTEWAVTQTNRFRAAVAGAGMTDLLSEFGTENIPGYDSWFWGWSSENPQGFLAHSPLLYAKNVKTPLLMIHGENDPIDPIGQDEEFYRALKYYGAPAEFVRYPREPHGFREKNHQLDWQRRMLDWFDAHLQQKTVAP